MESWHSGRTRVHPHLPRPQGNTESLRGSGVQRCKTTPHGIAGCRAEGVDCLWTGRPCSTSWTHATTEGEEDSKTQLVRTFQLKSRWKMLPEIDGTVAGDGLEEPGLSKQPIPSPKARCIYLVPAPPDVKCVDRGNGAGEALGSTSLSPKCQKSRSDRF